MTTIEDIPPWLTEDFIKFALQDGKESEVSIDEMVVEAAVPKGNNFTSTLLRVKVNYGISDQNEMKNVSLIVKKIDCGGIEEWIEKLGAVEKEFKMYTEILPRMKNVLGEDLGPKIYPSLDKEILIMEDLKILGYVGANKKERLTFEEGAAAVTAVAKFHAASVKLYEEIPELIRDVGREAMYSNCKEMKQFIMSFWYTSVKEIKKLPEFEQYRESLDEFTETIFEYLSETFVPRPGVLNVLNHGDFQSMNMMFKYQNGKVEVRLLDFQVPKYTFPAFDLRQFLGLCLKEEVRDNRLDEILDVYLKVLNETLEKCASPERLKKEELLKWMEELMPFDMFLSTMGMGPVTCNESEYEDFTSVTTEELCSGKKNPLEAAFKTEAFRRGISKRFKEYEKLGLLKRTVKK